jgi:hypothetical protein
MTTKEQLHKKLEELKHQRDHLWVQYNKLNFPKETNFKTSIEGFDLTIRTIVLEERLWVSTKSFDGLLTRKQQFSSLLTFATDADLNPLKRVNVRIPRTNGKIETFIMMENLYDLETPIDVHPHIWEEVISHILEQLSAYADNWYSDTDNKIYTATKSYTVLDREIKSLEEQIAKFRPTPKIHNTPAPEKKDRRTPDVQVEILKTRIRELEEQLADAIKSKSAPAPTGQTVEEFKAMLAKNGFKMEIVPA